MFVPLPAGAINYICHFDMKKSPKTSTASFYKRNLRK